MKAKLATPFIFVGLLITGITGQALAQTRIPGVKGQDYFVYSLTTHWNCDNVSKSIPNDLLEVNQTKYEVRIGGVIDSVNVTSVNTWDFNNGTRLDYIAYLDVESGISHYFAKPPLYFGGIVGTNLKEGDLLNPMASDHVSINQTIGRNYAEGGRPTNFVELYSPIQNETLGSNNQGINETIGAREFQYYLDQASGMLVAQNITTEYFTAKETASVIWTLIETNLWDASPPKVGVKKGDWIEYQIDTTGSLKDDAQSARMEIVDVQGSVLYFNKTTKFSNTTYFYENIALNLETGQLGDDFFIPANLSLGDAFFDAHAGRIMITGSEQRTYSGTTRTVISGHTPETTFYWDKQTGMLLEAYTVNSAINFTQKTVTDKTNILQSQQSQQPQPQTSAPEPYITYAIVAVVALVGVGFVFFLWRQRKKTRRRQLGRHPQKSMTQATPLAKIVGLREI